MKLKIVKSLTNINHTTQLKNRKISYIVIHYTAGTTSKKGVARNVANMFANGNTSASADFIVDDVEIVQYNPDIRNRYCWAVGGNKYSTQGGDLYGIANNKNTINIEICSSNKYGTANVPPNDPSWYFTPKVLKKAKKLVKYLMKEYDIPLVNVITHYNITGKLCPGIVGWNTDSGSVKKLNDFKASIMEDTNPIIELLRIK